ncbi:hypothetical protein KBC54_00965 [Patescibacteria group bacterium]|nr:hypothetical protein [Patescibacteria group bacterium]
MWLRTIGVSFLNWIANYILVIFVIVYLLPNDWSGYANTIPMWIVSAFVAFGFAYWLFSSRLPSSRDTAAVIGIWMVVNATMQVFHAFYYLGSLAPLLYGPDIYVQYVLEIIAIMSASYYVRRKKMQSTFGEGLVD